MVEIGIPVYKARETLPATLDSLVAQTCKDFVICLSIDGDNEDEYHWVAKPLEPHALDYISQRYIIPDRRITPETIEELLNGIDNNNINIVDFVDKLTE